MTKMTKPTITTELKTAVEDALVAQAYRETIEPVVIGYQTEILAEHQFEVAQKWLEMRPGSFADDRVILEASRSYLMEDDDFQTYIAATRVAQAEHGLVTESPDHCPLLVAESVESDAKTAVINAAKYIHKIDEGKVWNLDLRQRLFDLITGLVINLCPDISTQNVLAGI